MTIAAVTCVRDEADVIEEWIAHHLALGIGRIHIFDNMSEDTTRAKIDAIARLVPGVTVQSWNPPTEPQKAAYAAGLQMMRVEGSEWCAFLDADEFIGNGAAGGAIALGAADRVLMLEHAIYSVISPEGCASILWRDAGSAALAAEALRARRPEKFLAMGREGLGEASTDDLRRAGMFRARMRLIALRARAPYGPTWFGVAV